MVIPQRFQDIPQAVVVNFLHQCQEFTNRAVGETFTGEPIEVVAGQVGDEHTFVLAKRHGGGDQAQ